MKSFEVSDEVHAALQQLATRLQRTPDEVLASLLNVPAASPEAAEPLAGFVISGEFRANFTDAEKYLALLAWLAARHPAEFDEFILSHSSGRRYLGLSREEILAACQHNQAQRIAGTHFWAVMNLDAAAKRRFVARFLEFAGYRTAVIDFVNTLFGGRPESRRRLSALVA